MFLSWDSHIKDSEKEKKNSFSSYKCFEEKQKDFSFVWKKGTRGIRKKIGVLINKKK